MKKALILICFLLQVSLPAISQNQDTLRMEFHDILIEDKFFNVYRSDSVICKLLLANNDSLYLFKAINSQYVVTRLYDKNSKYDLIISDTCLYTKYKGDSLFDANFDGYTDYIVNDYSHSDSSHREVKKVFFLKGSNTKLITPVVLLNPYFDQGRKYILSMNDAESPHSATGVSVSKHIWKKNELMEIERLTKKDEETFILFTCKTKSEKEIKYIPEEYKKMDWFNGK